MRILLHRLGFLVALTFCLVLVSGHWPVCQSQQAWAESPQVSEESLHNLLGALEDPQQRAKLKEDLQALLAVHQAETLPSAAEKEDSSAVGNVLQVLTQHMQNISQQLASAGASLLKIPDMMSDLLQQAQDIENLRLWGEMALKVVFVLLAAWVAERAVRRLLNRARRSFEDRDQDHVGLRGLFFLVRTILELIPIAAFAAAAYGLLPLLEPRHVTQLVAVTLVNAHVLVRIILALARLVLVPGVPALRLLPLDNAAVDYLYSWVRRLASLGVYGYFILEAALLLGLPVELHTLLLKFLGLVITVLTIFLVLQNKEEVAQQIRVPQDERGGLDDSPESEPGRKKIGQSRAMLALRKRLADVWHVLVVIILLGLFATWALEVEGGFRFFLQALVLSGVVLALAAGLLRLTEMGIQRIFRFSDKFKSAHPDLEARLQRYQPIVRQALKAAVLIVAALALLQVWGLGTLSWLFSAQGGAVVSEILTLVLIIAGAFLIWELVSARIEQILTAEEQAEKKISTRKLTLLPLLRNIIRIALVLIAGMIVLTQLGINIGPLLAGAGVIGLAIGFGAQTLVRDIITGAFLLMEDSIAVGDWVEAGGHAGEVEKLTVRTVTLRDLSGTVHVVPFGDVTSVTNYNREYGYAMIDAGVAYRENYGHVVQALQDVALELRQDEIWGPDIIGDLEVFGLNNISDSAVEIRVRMKTRPLRQFAVRRAFLERMKQTFDERGIEIPFPHRTIWFGTGKDGQAPPLRLAQEK